VYDTAAERNPGVLKTCRQYLHHIQRSVFEGQLSPAQSKRFRVAVENKINARYDRVLVYTFPPGTQPERHSWGAPDSQPDDIL
jgi:CRISPR-associated protein Cas2